MTCFCHFNSSICCFCSSSSYLRVNLLTHMAWRFFPFFLSIKLMAVCSFSACAVFSPFFFFFFFPFRLLSPLPSRFPPEGSLPVPWISFLSFSPLLPPPPPWSCSKGFPFRSCEKSHQESSVFLSLLLHHPQF